MSCDKLRFYFGCASGSARKALQKMEEPNVMLNYATENNTPFETIDHLFVDSGGYSQLHTHYGYQSSDNEYLSYLAEHNPEWFVLRDYPCEPGLLSQLNRTVRDHQQRTTEHHRRLLDAYSDRNLSANPVAVLQGWSPSQYLTHLDELRSEGVLTQYVAIGSLCRRHDTDTVARIIHQVRDALPSRHRLHAFGVKTSVLRYPRIVEALDSADSTAYDFRTRMEESQSSWREQVYHYLTMKREIDACLSDEGVQRSLQQYAT